MNAYGVGLGTLYPNIQGGARFEPTRQPRTHSTPLRMRFGRFELDEANALLLCDGKPIDLPPRPFEVLCALARRPGSLLTKNALLDEVWEHRFVSESVLKTVIGKLRIALEDDARNPRFIETVPRRGYRFIAAGAAAAGDRPASLQPGSAERALREIRELLLLMIEQPRERNRAAARIVDYIGRWAPQTANEGR